MIGISKLYCGTVEPSDALRYGRDSKRLPSHLLQFSKDKKPVVVWNMTRRCNLKCVHCYAQAKDMEFKDELSTEEGKALIDDLAAFGSPVILFSGGEPTMRKDLPELAAYAREKGMRAVISTNGTLIDKPLAKKLKEVGLSYVGISLDGIRETNDKFRGMQGAFDAALKGLHNCQEEGIKVGLRFTINKQNVMDIPAIFDLLEEEKIPRICFYHLVYAGRGSTMVDEDLSLEESRKAVDLIMRPDKSPARERLPRRSPDRGQPLRRPVHLPETAERKSRKGSRSVRTPFHEPGQLLRNRLRLRFLGRFRARRPVLETLLLRKRPRKTFQ